MIADAPASVDGRSLRDALGRFATGVVIVTALGPGGRPVGMTMNSFNSVSLDPPLVLFSVDRRAFSLPAMKGADCFAINILGREQEDLSDRFARARVDKWSDIAYRPGRCGAPLLDGAIARIECVPHEIHESGDHLIFVCRVVGVQADARQEREPLTYFRGRYCGLDRDQERQAAWPLPIHY